MMNPYLLIFDEATLNAYFDLLQKLEADSPIDVLVISDKEGENQTYQYISYEQLKGFFETTANDYETILLSNKSQLKLFNDLKLNIDGYFSIEQKQLHLINELDEVSLRYFHCKFFEIYQNEKRVNIKGLTLKEFEGISKCICLNNQEDLDKLLRNETPIYCQFSYPKSPLTHFIKPIFEAGINATLLLANDSNQTPTSNSSPKEFLFLKPHFELWLCARPFATLGSLNFDLNKLLKEAKTRPEAIAGYALSEECAGNESVFSFTEAFASNNDLELTFNMDTMREDLVSLAQSKGYRLIAERTSKTSRLILVDKEKI